MSCDLDMKYKVICLLEQFIPVRCNLFPLLREWICSVIHTFLRICDIPMFKKKKNIHTNVLILQKLYFTVAGSCSNGLLASSA